MTLPLEVARQRVDELSRRIADLSSQKADAIRRYDVAIAKHRQELTRLQGEIVKDEKLLQPLVEPPDEKSIEQPKTASESAKPAMSQQSKTPAKRPTKTAQKSRKLMT